MSTLTSTSNLTTILAAYYDNASYEEDASLAKAKAFVTACRFLLLKIPKRAREGGGSEIEVEPGQLGRQLEAAQAFVFANSGTTNGAVRHASFENFRE